MQLAIKFSHWQAILSPKKVVLKGYDILLLILTKMKTKCSKLLKIQTKKFQQGILQARYLMSPTHIMYQ